MKKFDVNDIDKFDKEMLNINVHSKYTRYILQHYSTISFRVGLWLVLKNLGFVELYEKWKDNRLEDSQKVGSSSNKKNSVDNGDINSSDSDDNGEDVTISKFVLRMNHINSKYFDL